MRERLMEGEEKTFHQRKDAEEQREETLRNERAQSLLTGV